MAQGTVYGIPISTDAALTANSDFLVPSQKAVKTYADTKTTLAEVSTQTMPNFTAGSVQTNANLTGNDVTSVGNATTLKIGRILAICNQSMALN